MATVDLRTRPSAPADEVSPALFRDEMALKLAGNSELASRGAYRLGLPSLTLDVEGDAVTFFVTKQGLDVTEGISDDLVVSLDRATFSELIADELSTFGASLTGRATVTRGTADDFVAWEPALRCFLDGRPVYEPGAIDLLERDGSPLDLGRSFSLDDDPADVAWFLAQAGYLHVRSLFTPEEMAAVSADLDQAMAAAHPDDGASWWARTAAGESYPARVLGFNLASSALRDALNCDRFAAIGTFTGDKFIQRDPDTGDAAEGLLKKVGVVEGISDVSWHKDCSMGGHSKTCCGLVVGISVTGAGPESGELGVVAGSHRANVPPLGIEHIDLPRRALATATGDVTVHCSCTLHMSRPPVSAERRVVYTGFALSPRPGDIVQAHSHEEIRKQRSSLNGHVKRQQHGAELGAAMASHEL